MLSESGEHIRPIQKAMKCWDEEKKLFIDQSSHKQFSFLLLIIITILIQIQILKSHKSES